MKSVRLFPRSLTLMIALCCGARAQADTLWYNGVYDNRDAALNAVNIPIFTPPYGENQYVYDNFVVPAGQTWTITSVFSNNQIAFYAGLPTTGYFEIRSGVSTGNGGTLIASGTDAATATAITPVPGNYYVAPEYTFSVAVPSIVLTAGTYWLTVTPVDQTAYFNDISYVETTSGANAIGMPQGNDGNSYVTNNLSAGNGGLDFATGLSLLGPDGLTAPVDFSMGVVGSFSVPEPPSLLLASLGGGLVLLAHAAFRRRTEPSPSA